MTDTRSEATGSTRWSFSSGWIPEQSTGHEPEVTSRVELRLLNTAAEDSCVRATIYHEDREPVGPYEILVAGRRVRHVRVNDLIDPEAVPLGRPFGVVLDSDVPVVAELVYIDTRRDHLAITSLPGSAGRPGGSGDPGGPAN